MQSMTTAPALVPVSPRDFLSGSLTFSCRELLRKVVEPSSVSIRALKALKRESHIHTSPSFSLGSFVLTLPATEEDAEEENFQCLGEGLRTGFKKEGEQDASLQLLLLWLLLLIFRMILLLL